MWLGRPTRPCCRPITLLSAPTFETRRPPILLHTSPPRSHGAASASRLLLPCFPGPPQLALHDIYHELPVPRRVVRSPALPRRHGEEEKASAPSGCSRRARATSQKTQHPSTIPDAASPRACCRADSSAAFTTAGAVLAYFDRSWPTAANNRDCTARGPVTRGLPINTREVCRTPTASYWAKLRATWPWLAVY